MPLKGSGNKEVSRVESLVKTTLFTEENSASLVLQACICLFFCLTRPNHDLDEGGSAAFIQHWQDLMPVGISHWIFCLFSVFSLQAEPIP